MVATGCARGCLGYRHIASPASMKPRFAFCPAMTAFTCNLSGVVHMELRGYAFLRDQQRRFMRPDAARYLRPDAARFLKPGSEMADVYPALSRKWDGQPRLPEGADGAGRYTFGQEPSFEDATPGATRVHIERWIGNGDAGTGDGEGGSGSGFGNDLDSFLLAAAIPPGIGHNQGPPLEDPPKIPETKPSRSPSSYLRTAAIWIGRALSLRRMTAAAIFVGALMLVDWIGKKVSEILTYLDPPRTMEELQVAVDVPRTGTEVHHIMEQTAAKRAGLTQKQIDAPENRIRIPTFKHYDITGWYARPNKGYGRLSPREYLADKPVEEHMRVGREALILYEVLKP
jgi:hypothetical protein